MSTKQHVPTYLPNQKKEQVLFKKELQVGRAVLLQQGLLLLS